MDIHLNQLRFYRKVKQQKEILWICSINGCSKVPGNGDTVVFYFSGHGTSVRDQNHDEADGMDEALCPFDVDPKTGKNLILDDELGDLIRTLRGRDTVVILDSCHSGGMTEVSMERLSAIWEIRQGTQRFLTIADYQPTYFPKALPDEPEGCLFMVAARENQVALETNQTGDFSGAFTYGLIDALQSNDQITYSEMHEHAIKVVRDILQLSQDPQMSPKN